MASEKKKGAIKPPSSIRPMCRQCSVSVHYHINPVSVFISNIDFLQNFCEFS